MKKLIESVIAHDAPNISRYWLKKRCLAMGIDVDTAITDLIAAGYIDTKFRILRRDA